MLKSGNGMTVSTIKTYPMKSGSYPVVKVFQGQSSHTIAQKKEGGAIYVNSRGSNSIRLGNSLVCAEMGLALYRMGAVNESQLHGFVMYLINRPVRSHKYNLQEANNILSKLGRAPVTSQESREMFVRNASHNQVVFDFIRANTEMQFEGFESSIVNATNGGSCV